MFHRLTFRTWLVDAISATVIMLVLLGFDLLVWSFAWAVPALVLSEAFVLWALMCVRRVQPVLTVLGALLLGIVHVCVPVFQISLVWCAVFVLLYTAGRYGSGIQRALAALIALVGTVLIALYIALPRAVVVAEPGGTTVVRQVDAINSEITVLFIAIPMFTMFGFSLLLGMLIAAIQQGRRTRKERDEERLRAAQAAELAVIEEERSRIARDMHDVVAHSLAVMIAQANGARYAHGVEIKDASLKTIARVGQEALGDVRVLLARLRHVQAPDPQASMAELPELIARMESSGLAVAFAQDGEPLELDRQQDLALYRIAQESLTNALRHGDGSASVQVLWWPDRVTLRVENPARAAPGAVGHGLVGMRERAGLVGGSLDAGRAADRFVVTATIPLATTARSASAELTELADPTEPAEPTDSGDARGLHAASAHPAEDAAAPRATTARTNEP